MFIGQVRGYFSNIVVKLRFFIDLIFLFPDRPAIDGLLSEFEEDMNQVESVLYDERTKEDIG